MKASVLFCDIYFGMKKSFLRKRQSAIYASRILAIIVYQPQRISPESGDATIIKFHQNLLSTFGV